MNCVVRKFTFDAAHRVLGHGNRCRFLHGHRYEAEITVEARDLDKLGMVVDFSIIKETVGKWIDENWDHNILLHSQDPLIILLEQACSEELFSPVAKLVKDSFGGQGPFVFQNCNPTAENIARYLHDFAKILLPSSLRIRAVTIHETANCRAIYMPPAENPLTPDA